MNGSLLLCREVRNHGDGTFSFLDGGIRTIKCKPGDYSFNGSLLILIKPNKNELGQHTYHVGLKNPAGLVVMQTNDTIDIPEEKHMGQVQVADFELLFSKQGEYEFSLMIDDKLHATYTFNVEIPELGAKDEPSESKA